MKYKKGDRILYNRQKFGTVISDQFDPSKVDVIFDRDNLKVVPVPYDTIELVADARHEAALAVQINTPVTEESPGLAGVLTKLADDLDAGADWETNQTKLRTNMKIVAHRLRVIAGEYKEEA